MSFESILAKLANRDLILPYFESAITSERWPASYSITVDSSPYYGAGDGYFHPSTHPLMGERELYYHFHPDTRDKVLKERPSLRREMFLSIGSAVHSVLQTQMQMCELIHDPATDIEREYVNHEHHVRGRIDWVVTHPRGIVFPVEFKTQNTFDFRRQETPKKEWLAQLNLAMDAMNSDFGIVLTSERGGNFDMAEFHVNRDQELLDDIYGKFDRVREAIATNTPPKHCCSLDSQQMDKCPARYQCWLKGQDNAVTKLSL